MTSAWQAINCCAGHGPQSQCPNAVTGLLQLCPEPEYHLPSCRGNSMADTDSGRDSAVAVLVDCDNTTPEILEYALRVVAQFGRWCCGEAMAITPPPGQQVAGSAGAPGLHPRLQYQHAAGKNTADIALALDAVEALFDQRADTFCLVTSDPISPTFCRSCERGATVHIVGEAKTPDALRNASDQFFEWLPRAPAEPAGSAAAAKAAPPPAPCQRPSARRPFSMP